MIHRILVGPETEISPLKKLFRQKLMTGGAVVRLRDGLNSNDLECMVDAFSEGVTPNGVQAAVLGEIARHPAATDSIRGSIAQLNL